MKTSQALLAAAILSAGLLSATGAHASNSNNSRTAENELAGITPVPAGYVIPKWADRLDIVGVKIGMPAAQAIQALRTHNPKFDIKTEQIQLENVGTPSAWVVNAKVSNGTERIEVRLALPPLPSVATAIRRVISFSLGNEPTITSVMESLQAKYGNGFTRINSNRNLYTFIWRLDGQRVEQPGKATGCYYDVLSTREVNDYTEFIQEFQNVGNAIRIAKACGVVVMASIHPSLKNDQLADSFIVKVSSEPFRASSLQKTVTYLNSLDQARRNKEAAGRKSNDVKM